MRDDQGIFVSRKMMIWMIFASVFINVLFLLMGMLIGKDDRIWKEREIADPVAEFSSEEPEKEDDYAMELSLYERENEGPPQPTDVSYLDGESTPVTKAEQEAVVVEQKPKPEPEPEPTSKVAEPVRPSDPPVSSSEGDFYVQVMASKDASKVREVSSKLRQRGFAVFTQDSAGLTKISVGYFQTSGQAKKAKKEIDSALKIESWVRKR